jgi:hypothetical protein
MTATVIYERIPAPSECDARVDAESMFPESMFRESTREAGNLPDVPPSPCVWSRVERLKIDLVRDSLSDSRRPPPAASSGLERQTNARPRRPARARNRPPVLRLARISGGGEIRTLGTPYDVQRFSRPPHSTALPPLQDDEVQASGSPLERDRTRRSARQTGFSGAFGLSAVQRRDQSTDRAPGALAGKPSLPRTVGDSKGTRGAS